MGDVLPFKAANVYTDYSGQPARRREVEPLVDEYVQYVRASGSSQNTAKLRRYHLGRLAADTGTNLTSITARQIVNWIASQGWAPESLKAARASVRGFYAWAVRCGHVDINPAADLPAVRVPTGTPKPAPDHVLNTALGQASDRDKLMLMLAAYAGLRRSEIAMLRWQDVEWSGLRVTGKGGKTRTVPLGGKLKAALDRERDWRQRGSHGTGWRYVVDHMSEFVFPSDRNHHGERGAGSQHVHPETVGAILSRHLGKGWSGHTLRHRFATRAYAAERDLLTVQALLGHSQPETTARYTATPDSAAKRAVDAAAGG